MDWLPRVFALDNPMWYYYPLALVVGLVYKTTQYDRPRDIARGVLHFFASVTGFMILLAIVLYVVSEWI